MGVSAGAAMLAKNDGVSAYGTLTTVAESPKKAGLFYTGADDGTVSISPDGGRTWTKVSNKFPGLPHNTYVSRIAASAFDERVAYATFDGHREDDYAPYVYATGDAGRTWRSIGASLPAGQSVRCITEDPKNANVLYVGTEFGIFVTLDRGAHWLRLRSGLPTVPVAEITIHPRANDMLVATHGRSIWILDDLAPIQQAAAALETDATLFDIRPAMTFFDAPEDRPRWLGDRPFWGRNPTFGAALSFYLKQAATDVRVTVRDATGGAITELSGDATAGARQAGINRVYWDLRHQPLAFPKIPGEQRPGPTTYFDDPLPGPFVLADEYRVTLTVDGKTVGTKTVRVTNDRLVTIGEADRRAWHDTALALHRWQRSAYEAAEAVVVLTDAVRTLERLIRRAAPRPSRPRAARLTTSGAGWPI